MPKKIVFLFSFLIIVFLLVFRNSELLQLSNRFKLESNQSKGKISLRDRIDLAWQQEKEMTMDPMTGEVPKERLLEAWDYKESIISKTGLGKAAIGGILWAERGPSNCGGRTRSLLVDLNDNSNNSVWVGSVGGGLWKTIDINSTNPTWIQINGFMPNLAITGIAQSRTDPSVMYYCTGEGNGNSDAVRGLGVWKSTDAGVSWNQLASTNNSNFYYNSKVFCPLGPDTVFIASNTGLYRSINGGSTFVKVLGAGISSAGGNYCYDIECAANGTLYASTSSGSNATGTIHKSYNNGTTWTTPLTLPTTFSKREMELGLATNDTNTIWAVVENAGTIVKIMKSTNAGVTWTATTSYPVDSDTGIPSTDISRGQAWYDISFAVDPNNSQVCFVGGIDLFKTSNGGNSWQQVSHWYGGYGFQEVHADQHLISFSPGSSTICYFTNDGGVWRSTNATATIPTISDKNNGYSTAQFYACAVHPTTTNYFLAGTQDNGTHRFTGIGYGPTTEATGGDGAFCHIDQNQAQYQFTSYVYSNYYRSTNSGTSFSSALNNNTGRFINPSDYDDSTNMMYMATASGSYIRWNNPQTGNTISTVAVTGFASTQVSAVKVSPNVLNRVYFGAGGKLIRVDSAHTGTSKAGVNISSTSFPNGFLNCIEIEKNNENHIAVTFTNYGVASVWETRNGGTNWTNIEGNLPDMPIRWIMFHPQNANYALLATELGVWSTDSINGSSTNWGSSNNGLANVRVDMLQLRGSDMLVAAATHGLGLYTCNLPSLIQTNPVANFTSNKVIIYPGKQIQFFSTSSGATSYIWDFGDNTSSTGPNPLKTYNLSGIYNVKLTINGVNGPFIVKNAYIKVMPYRGVPYLTSNGGNFESNFTDFVSDSSLGGTPFQLGNSTITGKSGTISGTKAWVTGLTASNYLDNSLAYLYTPSFNFSAFGNYTIQFWMKNVFESAYDGLRVEYSLNGGDTWSPLGSTVTTNWYDFANTTTTAVFPSGQAFFNGPQAFYTQRAYISTTLYGAPTVCFRFVFKSDASITDIGCAIEDFQILGPTNSPFPVNFISFDAKRISQAKVELNWLTAFESNNFGFEVERKFGFNDEFEKVGFVNGNINSQSKQNYKFIDNNNSTDNTTFYRLKQIDLDGKFMYSKIIALNPESEIKTKFVNAVLPTGSAKIFQIQRNSETNLNYSVVSSSGQNVKAKSMLLNNEINLSELRSGIYFIVFENISNSSIQVEKILLD